MASVEATSSNKSSETLSLGENTNQPVLLSYPRRKFGLKSPVFRAFQSSWYKRWPWIHYDQTNDCVFCFTCLKAKGLGMLKACTSKGEEAFLSRGYTNWKDVSGKHGGFSKHENSQVHKHSIEIATKSMGDVGELLLSEVKKEKEKNRAYLKKVLENVIFLARQGLSFRGTWVASESSQELSGAELNSNFHQLLLLRCNDDPTILEHMQHKVRKYTDHHIQNELLKILSLGHLRLIAASINESGYFTLESNEVTDASNKEQVIICLRWVDVNFEVHEDFIGLHSVPDIQTATIVSVLKDTLLRMNLQLSMCRGQCFDGAANMKKTAEEIKAIEPKALYLHCYGHSLNLAVSDTLKEVKPMSDALDHSLEICKLIKFSPRREALFNKLKEELSPYVPGLRTLCPTRWTVRGNSLESIRRNYATLFAVWEEAVDVVKLSDVKARINGVAAKMKEFRFLFCLILAERLLKHSDNLSRSMQATYMPAVEAKQLSELCIKVLQKMRDDGAFDLFWEYCLTVQKELQVDDPVLERQRKRPRWYEDGTADAHFHEDPKTYYRAVYFQCIDAAMSTISQRFQQKDFSVYANLEQLLVKAFTKMDYSEEYKAVTEFYGYDFCKPDLKTQLEVLGSMDIKIHKDSLTFSDIHRHFQSMPSSQALYLNQVALVIKFVLLMPATNAVSERSASALRRIKTYLRTTMSQQRANNIMVLHIHKHLTDAVNQKEILNEFITSNDDRHKHFGLFE